jgi:hypothetical protein
LELRHLRSRADRRLQQEAACQYRLEPLCDHAAGGRHLFQPQDRLAVERLAIYVFNFENKATDYESGEILNLEGNITKNLGRWGVGVSAYAMIQTTPDTGAGARLGAFESRVNGIGPLVTYTLGDPKDPLTFIAKYYKEFDAENTFEGESFDIAVTAKF